MASHKCAFCGQIFNLNSATFYSHFTNFNTHQRRGNFPGNILLSFYKCPNEECAETSIHIKGEDSRLQYLNRWVHPDSYAVQFPDYVPLSIRNDYTEAHKILELSPKASATLSRRALQGMIRDYWNESKQNLHQEIEAIKDRIDIDEFNALMSLKSIGNIGAHPEKDINTIVDVEIEEARQLVELIEMFIEDWYVKSHDKRERLARINQIADEKKSQADQQNLE